MPAARYWRIVGIETYAGGDLELSELHLYGTSGRLDAAATLTSTIAPTAGTLAALQDDNLATTCRFAGAAVRAGGFALVWDFGTGNTADAGGVRLGASADQSAFMAGRTLQFSTDGAQWQRLAGFARYAWPGAYAMAPTGGSDPHYASVSLLLHFDGANGSTTFTDSSATPKTVAAYGDARISTAQSLFGGGSISLDGAGDYLNVPHHPDLNLTSGDFALECFIFVKAFSSANLAVITKDGVGGVSYPQYAIEIKSTGVLQCFLGNGAGVSPAGTNYSGQTAVKLNTWSHVAVVKSGGTCMGFLDGVLQWSAPAATMYDGGKPLTVGYHIGQPAGSYFTGYIAELRITKGVARYTANFTPPTEAFADGAGGTVIAPTLHTAASAAQISASALVPAFSTRRAPSLQLARDVEVGGPGTIYGTTKTKGMPNTPTRARVVLLHQRSKLPVRETWSDPVTGAFAFTSIDTNQQFITLAEDAAGNFRPVAANRLTPEVQP